MKTLESIISIALFNRLHFIDWLKRQIVLTVYLKNQVYSIVLSTLGQQRRFHVSQ